MQFSSTSTFTRFDRTLCVNTDDYQEDGWYTETELESLVTTRQTDNICHDYCLQVNCDSYNTMYRYTYSPSFKVDIDCTFSFFISNEYEVGEGHFNGECFVRGSIPVDCSSNSNCNPQLSVCGGTLPIITLQKTDLLSCIPNASTFDFDTKSFIRKSHPSNDFFYNDAEKTFMSG